MHYTWSILWIRCFSNSRSSSFDFNINSFSASAKPDLCRLIICFSSSVSIVAALFSWSFARLTPFILLNKIRSMFSLSAQLRSRISVLSWDGEDSCAFSSIKSDMPSLFMFFSGFNGGMVAFFLKTFVLFIWEIPLSCFACIFLGYALTLAAFLSLFVLSQTLAIP